MKKIVIIFILCISGFITFAQQLMHINTDSLRIEDKRGQNRSKFVQMYTGYLYTTPPEEDLKVKYGSSYEWNLGLRYKKKLTGMFSVVGEMEYNFKSYLIDNDYSVFINTDEALDLFIPENLQSQKFNFNTFSTGLLMRINFDPKRGNNVGKYLEFGGDFGYVFKSAYTTKSKDERFVTEGSTKKEKLINLNSALPISYSAKARLGMGRLALVSTYRLSDNFDDLLNYTDNDSNLPRLNIGIELGLY